MLICYIKSDFENSNFPKFLGIISRFFNFFKTHLLLSFSHLISVTEVSGDLSPAWHGIITDPPISELIFRGGGGLNFGVDNSVIPDRTFTFVLRTSRSVASPSP